jgi:outer membrane protein OmpA-like peptidoglycan-associated protein
MHGVGALTVSALLLMMLPAHAQITYLREPPTVEQLQQMLGAPRAGATLRSRGVVWEGGQPPAAAALPAKGAQGSQGTQATQGAPAGAPASSAQLEAAAGSDPGAGPAVAMPISFDAGSARVSRPSIAYVDVVAQLLAKEPSLRLTIEGHTDASGNAQRNLVLSWDRALAVYRVLVERYGIDGRRLQPLGRGSQDPLEGLPVESPMNRRVQFRVAA